MTEERKERAPEGAHAAGGSAGPAPTRVYKHGGLVFIGVLLGLLLLVVAADLLAR